MTPVSRRQLLLRIGALAAAVQAPLPGHAQAYPARPLRLVVPFPPGGPSDGVGRYTAQVLGERLRQNVVVDNKAGAGGAIGADAVARAPADGYHLLLGTNDSMSILPALRRKLPYEPLRDFTPVALLARLPLVFAVHPSVPANTIAEFARLARSKPRSLQVATAGFGTVPHLAMEMLGTNADAPLLHVPYKGGGPAVTDTLSGQVAMVSTGVASAAQFVKEGKLRALATTGDARSALLPDVPTMAESGFPNFVVMSWFGILGPARLEPAVVGRLSSDLLAIAATPAFQARMLDLGGSARQSPLDAAEFGRFMARELDQWRQVVAAARVPVED